MLLLCSAQSIHAETLSLRQAIARLQSDRQEAAAMRQLGISTSSTATDYQLAYTARSEADSANLFYVVNARPGTPGNALTASTTSEGGFLILSADDLAPALLAFGPSHFVADSVPANVRYWLQGYERAIEQARRQGKTLAQGSNIGLPVSALIQTKWNQQGSYVTLAQQRVDAAVAAAGETPFETYTGCVATALAQVLNYYQYPERGTGSKTYQFDVEHAGKTANGSDTTWYVPATLSADFSSSIYDWSNMARTYDYYYDNFGEFQYCNNSAAEKAAVARLMYDCGVAVSMGYGPEGSGAYSENWTSALTKYFGYDKSAVLVYKDYFSDQDWMQMLYTELTQKRPILYSGDTGKSGHAFICDGYYRQDLFHFNWGWGGYCDGYYSMIGANALNPDGDAYANNQTAVCGIMPDQGGEPVSGTISCEEINELMIYDDTQNSYITVDPNQAYPMEWVRIRGWFFNNGTTELRVRLGMKFVKADDPTIVHYEPFTWPSDTLFPGYGYNNYYCLPYALPQAGKYYVYPAWIDASADCTDTSMWHDDLLNNKIQEIPTITFSNTESYTLQYRGSNGKIQSIKDNESLSCDNYILFSGPLAKISDPQIEVARLGLKFVKEDDSSCSVIIPSTKTYINNGSAGTGLIGISARSTSIPQAGRYRVYPVWQDSNADWAATELWHDFKLFLKDELPTVTFSEGSWLCLAQEPQLTLKQSQSKYLPYLSLSLLAQQDITNQIQLQVYIYGNSASEPNRYQYITTFNKYLNKMSKGQITTLQDMKIMSEALTAGREYLYEIYYSYTRPGQPKVSMEIGPMLNSNFSIESYLSDIDVVEAETLSAPTSIFDLQGNLVSAPLQPGLYIINGKKVRIDN